MQRTSAAQQFDAFVQDHGERLLRTAVLLTGDTEAGQDLLQATLEKTWQNWRQVPGGRADIAEEYARAALARRAVRLRSAAGPEVPTGELPDVVDPRPSPSAEVDLLVDLRRALVLLPARQRTVLVLRYFEDLSESQTAAVLGLTVGTVKSTCWKALRRLREDPALRVLIRDDDPAVTA